MLGVHLIFEFPFIFRIWTWIPILKYIYSTTVIPEWYLMSGLYPVNLFWYFWYVDKSLPLYRVCSTFNWVTSGVDVKVCWLVKSTTGYHTIKDCGWCIAFFEHLIAIINWCSRCVTECFKHCSLVIFFILGHCHKEWFNVFQAHGWQMASSKVA